MIKVLCRLFFFVLSLWSFPFLIAIEAGGVPFSTTTPASIVERGSEVDEIETRLNVAKIYFWKSETLPEAYKHIRILWGKAGHKNEIKLLYARMMLKIQDFETANAIAESLMQTEITDIDILISLASFQAELGNAVISRDLFIQIKQLLKTPEQVKSFQENYAQAQELWGDWVQSEIALSSSITSKNALQRKSELASLFQRSQKFPQAEQIYVNLIATEPKTTAHFDLVKLKISENDFQYASDLIDSMPTEQQQHLTYFYLLGEIAIKLKDYQRARDIFVTLAEANDFFFLQAQFLTNAAIAKYKAEEYDEAQELFIQANSYHPNAVKPRFYLRLLCLGCECLVEELLNAELSPQELKEWAICFQAEGFINDAINILQSVTENYPAYFPASWMLAELYATSYIYEAALLIYEALVLEFPNSQMILLQEARCLSWMKFYKCSLCYYDELIDQDPSNQQFVLEKARIALLDHNPYIAADSYNSLLGSVSNHFFLACFLNSFSEKENVEDYWNGKIYKNYGDSWALFLIHKETFLEMQAKFALWQNLPFTAINNYEDWLNYSPGNTEALFEYGQVLQGLGLNDCADAVYDEILDINRNYSIANSAKIRIEYLETPKVVANLSVWAEKGYGALSQITRTKIFADYQYPFNGQAQLTANYCLFSDHPYDADGEYIVHAVGLTYEQVFNESASLKAVLLPKIGGNYDIRHHFLGNLLFKYRFNDTVVLSTGLDRTDEFYNRFGIEQGIQGSAVWGKIAWEAQRKLYLEALYKYLDYTDNNNLNVAAANISYELTESPKIIKLSLQGEYRNCAKTNEYIYAGDTLIDIIHPYWSPQHYYVGRFLIEWNHNLTKIDFIGAEQLRYSIRGMVGDDTDSNWAGSLAAEFHYDWDNRWSFQISALGHYSRLWKAAGVWSNLSYAF